MKSKTDIIKILRIMNQNIGSNDFCFSNIDGKIHNSYITYDFHTEAIFNHRDKNQYDIDCNQLETSFEKHYSDIAFNILEMLYDDMLEDRAVIGSNLHEQKYLDNYYLNLKNKI